MSYILVIGGGRQGSLVARDFVEDNHSVTIADIRNPNVLGTHYQHFDVNQNKEEIKRPDGTQYILDYIKSFDLVVHALPGTVSFPVSELIAQAGVKCADLTFAHKDIFTLDEVAKKCGSIIIPDCGLAPGLPNIVIGHELSKQDINRISIYVGGVAQDKSAPYGYVCSWSPADLKTEYERESKVVMANTETGMGKLFMGSVDIPDIGTMEYFYSDGLRTLLRLKDEIPFMREVTLRWPGHVADIKKLLESDQDFVETISSKCSKGKDMVVLMIDIDGQERSSRWLMVDKGTEDSSSMSKTTAHTCYAFGKLLLSGQYNVKGIHPPEHIGRSSEKAFDTVMAYVREKGINLHKVQEKTWT